MGKRTEEEAMFAASRIQVKTCLNWMRKAGLKQGCKLNGLPVSGTKTELVERLWHHFRKSKTAAGFDREEGHFMIKIESWQ